MRRLLIGFIAVGIVLAAGVALGQDSALHAMPEKVRAFLDRFVGTWTYDGSFKGRATIEWDAGRGCLIITGQEEFGGGIAHWTELIHWDGTSPDGIVISSHFTSGEAIACSTIHGKILSPTLMKGKKTAVRFGQEDTAEIQIKLSGKDEFVSEATDIVVGGKRRSDETFVFSRVKPMTRQDFEEFCKLNEGAWVGQVPLRDDIPGVGKKGELATAHYEYTIIEDGVALVGKSYWPEGTSTWFITYDKVAKEIKSMGASPVFGVSVGPIHYANRTWTCTYNWIAADGSVVESTAQGTFSADGNTLKATETVTQDGKQTAFDDVWQRMNRQASK